MNLAVLKLLADAFQLPIGYSDHTEGIEILLAAVALGAVVIEKHFTTDKSLPNADHKISLSPDELKEMVKGIRLVEKAIGNGIKKLSLLRLKQGILVERALFVI